MTHEARTPGTPHPTQPTDDKHMRAAIYREYGGPEVVHVEEAPRPTPAPKEVLIRVRATIGAKVVAGPASEDPAHLPLLAKLAEDGKYKAVIDCVFPFEQIVEAHRRVDTGRKRGNVVVVLP